MRQLLRFIIHGASIAITLHACALLVPWPSYQWLLRHVSTGGYTVFGLCAACCMNRFPLGAVIVYLAVLIADWPDTTAVLRVGVPVLAGGMTGMLLQHVIAQLTTNEETTNDPPAIPLRRPDPRADDTERPEPSRRDAERRVLRKHAHDQPRDR